MNETVIVLRGTLQEGEKVLWIRKGATRYQFATNPEMSDGVVGVLSPTYGISNVKMTEEEMVLFRALWESTEKENQ